MKKTLFLILTVFLLAFVCHADSSDYTYTVLDEAEKTCRITKYSGADEFLSIPGTLDGYTVTQIGDRAFLGNDAIVTLTIPETIKYIGIDAFWHCSSLKTVTLPASFPGSGLAAGAFGYCEALEKIDLPEGMKSLGQLMFIGCKALQEIEIPETVRTIGANAFTDCAGLKTLTLPSALTSIGEWAFRGCTE
ncbi:MAG: leucine-rich repeat domain-containing protein, partial [Clostridia bacterium]|nr:leucine-rich repeat domain-containing protein [Clostridia bacterium]